MKFFKPAPLHMTSVDECMQARIKRARLFYLTLPFDELLHSCILLGSNARTKVCKLLSFDHSRK